MHVSFGLLLQRLYMVSGTKVLTGLAAYWFPAAKSQDQD